LSGPLVRGYDLELASPDCHPGSEKTRLFVRLNQDIGEVLPYLNTALNGKDYNHDARILLWADSGRTYAFRPQEIAIAPVRGMDEARKVAEAIVIRINDVWSKRSKIEPNIKGKKPLPNVLDLYKLLPKTNCKECGLPTCMAFAMALRNDSARRASCRYLSEQDYMKAVQS